MKIFRKPTVVKDEPTKQVEQVHGESESLPVFKGQGKRKPVPDKSKSRNTPKHG